MGGSPPSGGERLVAIGRLGRAHGVSGEIRLDPMGTMPKGLKRYRFLRTQKPDGTGEVLEVEGWRWNSDVLLVKFRGISDRDQAGRLANRLVHVARSELPPLKGGEYYHADLPGLKVVDDAGEVIGEVEDVKPWGEYDMLFVRTGEKTWMLPVIGDYVKDILPEEGLITVDLPEGLGP